MNIRSIVFYTVLIQQCNESLQYWNAQPASTERDKMLQEFAELKLSHENNIKRLKQDIPNDTDFIDEILKYIDELRDFLRTFGGFIKPEIKAWFETVLKAAEKILEQLNNIP